jgi:hypothetical protein
LETVTTEATAEKPLRLKDVEQIREWLRGVLGGRFRYILSTRDVEAKDAWTEEKTAMAVDYVLDLAGHEVTMPADGRTRSRKKS